MTFIIVIMFAGPEGMPLRESYGAHVEPSIDLPAGKAGILSRKFLAGLEGIEPPLEVLETPGLPLTYSPTPYRPA